MFSSCNTVKSSTNPDKNNSKFCTSGFFVQRLNHCPRCFLFKMIFSPTEPNKVLKKHVFLLDRKNMKKQMQHLGTHRFLEFQDMLCVCFSLYHLFLTARSARLRLHQMLVWHARKAEKLKSRSFIQLDHSFGTPPKKFSQIRTMPTIDSPWPSFVSSVA